MNKSLTKLALNSKLKLEWREVCNPLHAMMTLRTCVKALAPRLAERFAHYPDSELEQALFSSLEREFNFASVTDRVQAAFNLALHYYAYKIRIARTESAIPTSSPADLAQAALKQVPFSFRSAAHEWLGFVPIYSRNRMGAFCIVEKGVRTHVNTEPAELFARLLILRPKGFILAHNHPSEDLTPSREDHELTFKVGVLAQDLGISLLGHWIVTGSKSHWIQIGRAA